jgi:hypothetical protein
LIWVAQALMSGWGLSQKMLDNTNNDNNSIYGFMVEK